MLVTCIKRYYYPTNNETCIVLSGDKALRSPKNYRMTRLTFGVSASSFAANMAVKQNAIDFTKEYPKAASIVPISFYVDDGLTDEGSDEKARKLQNQLQALFTRAGFLLRKWMSSEPDVLRHLEPHLLENNPIRTSQNCKLLLKF